jgi:hypothetical protein
LNYAVRSTLHSLHTAHAGLTCVTDLVADTLSPEHEPIRHLESIDKAGLLYAAQALVEHATSLTHQLDETLSVVYEGVSEKHEEEEEVPPEK